MGRSAVGDQYDRVFMIPTLAPAVTVVGVYEASPRRRAPSKPAQARHPGRDFQLTIEMRRVRFAQIPRTS